MGSETAEQVKMSAFNRVQQMRRADASLAAEVRRELVNTLYLSTISLATGAIAGAVIATLVALQTRDPWIILCAALIVVLGSARVVINPLYNRTGPGRSPQAVLLWERIYQVAAAGYAGLLGLLALLSMIRSPNEVVYLLTTATAIGYAAGIAGRNAGRPSIAILQLVISALPVAIGLLLKTDNLHRGLGLVILVFIVGMVNITFQTYNVVLRAFVTVREKEVLAEALERKAKEAQDANEAKTRFLATMSHEIRTPLNGVLTMAQIMNHHPLASDQKARLQVISDSGEALLLILNDVLDLAKVEAGKLEIVAHDFGLDELVGGISSVFGPMATHKGLSFTVTRDPGGDVKCHGDSNRIRQIIQNLMANAIKFTERGYVHLHLAFASNQLEVVVRDSGVGIAPDYIGALFERFSQADSSTTRRFGGAGLGLAICWEVTKLLGGEISVNSVLGEGSEFRVRLPLTAVAPTQPLLVDPATSVPAPLLAAVETGSDEVSDDGPTPIRVLCAEDNAVNQMVLKCLLDQFGFDSAMVENGAEALELWRNNHYDLVILDVQMPVMDGPTAARTIRREEAQKGMRPIPIMALTANVMERQVQDYRAAGMDSVVAKPIRVEVLYAEILALLEPASADEAPDGPTLLARECG